MLWRKAWLESRARFAVCAAVIAALCLVLLLFEAELRRRAVGAAPPSYAAYVDSRIYAGVVRVVFVVFALVLGLGGLQRERAHRTLGFTLALPVRRTHHAIARAGVGLGEIAALAVIPALLVPACSAAVGQSSAWRDALGHAWLWWAGGALAFAVALVASVIVPGDLAALAAALVMWKLVPPVMGRVPGLERIATPDEIMSGRGMAYFDPHSHALVGGTPWLAVAGLAAVAAVVLAIAVAITARQRLSW